MKRAERQRKEGISTTYTVYSRQHKQETNA